MPSSPEEIRNFLKNNRLFEGFSERQLSFVIPLINEVTFKKDELVMKEGDLSDDLFLLKEGEVEVFRQDADGYRHHLANFKTGDILGELPIIDRAPRTASVRALGPSTFYVLSMQSLQALADEDSYQRIVTKLSSVVEEAKLLAIESPIFPLLIHNIAREVSHRIRSTNDMVVETMRKELSENRARIAMGIISMTVVGILCLYIVVLKTLEATHFRYASTSEISIPLTALIAVITFFALLKTGYPLSTYGLTLKEWRPAIREALFATGAVMIFYVIYKWIWIQLPVYSDRHLFEPDNSWWILGYIFLAPLQEFIIRGALQSSFQEFLTGRDKYFWSIFLSNLIFSVNHFHVSMELGLSVFFPGLLWGWLYSRHRTLIGVSISHIIIGVWVLYIVGV